MFTEKEIVTYSIVGIVSIGAIFIIDAYIKGINTYIPIMIEMRR